MKNIYRFLELYKELEMYLDGKFPSSESSIKEYIHTLERSMVKEDVSKAAILDFLRTTRNHIVHRNVEEYVEIPQKTIQFLENEISKFKNPILAINIMTPLKKVYYIRMNYNTLEVLNNIYTNSYDIVPILNKENQVIGVFSLDVILKSIYQRGVGKIEKESVIGDFADLIGLNDQIKERFEFVSGKSPLDEIMSLFDSKNEKKLKMLFVTSNGSKKTPLIGIITPHDIINSK